MAYASFPHLPDVPWLLYGRKSCILRLVHFGQCLHTFDKAYASASHLAGQQLSSNGLPPDMLWLLHDCKSCSCCFVHTDLRLRISCMAYASVLKGMSDQPVHRPSLGCARVQHVLQHGEFPKALAKSLLTLPQHSVVQISDPVCRLPLRRIGQKLFRVVVIPGGGPGMVSSRI